MQTAKIMSAAIHDLHQSHLTWGASVHSVLELKNQKDSTIKKTGTDILEINILELKETFNDQTHVIL